MKEEDFKEILRKYNQEHIINAYQRADDEKKEELIKQVEKIDFEQLKELYSLTKKEIKFENSVIEPIQYTDILKLTDDEKEKYISKGEEIIRSGKLAVITMAGGQGTRLGHNGPKGTFDFGLDSHKSLFEILTDGLKEAMQKYGVAIPWYIMTSKENNDETKSFFEANNYFEYPKNSVRMFFKQGELPMIDEDGKIIIDEYGKIKEAADGHGGIFGAIFKNGVLDDMKNKGIEWVFVGAVDNPLVQMADPLFIGYTALNNYYTASKTIAKAYPEEKVGVFCKKDGRPYVIEYSELSEEQANQRDANGELVFGEAHVLLNLFHITTLEKVKEVNLPYHCAHKKATYTDINGNIIKPEKPNAYKFEAFIFDAFALLPEIGILRGIRENDFAPIKNAEGNDSPETARILYLDFQKRKREGKI